MRMYNFHLVDGDETWSIETEYPVRLSSDRIEQIIDNAFDSFTITSNSDIFSPINSKNSNNKIEYDEIEIEYHDVVIEAGSYAQFVQPSYSVPDTNKHDIHVWWEATGQVASWVHPGNMDYGIAPPGKQHPKWSFTIDVPENTRKGFYSFTWEKHCLIVYQDQSVPCGNGFQKQFEIEVTPSNEGGCLIATATYGSELAPQVQQLRELRDNKLLQTESGTSFMNTFNDFYYSFSPYIADYERENPVFKEIVKIAITPMISSLSILNHVDMDSESEVLGYGIGIILLNLGMYFVAPAIVISMIMRRKINYGNIK